MNVLIEGLGLLLKDNDDARRPFAEQVASWRSKSAEELDHEMGVLRHARGVWLLISVVAWNAIALSTLGVIVNHLFKNDFHLTFARLITIVVSWVTALFVVWLVASVFDRYAGFERWFKAFELREVAGKESTERMEALLEMTQQYPDIKAYKDEVLKRRPLYGNDLRIMEEMGRKHRNQELLARIEQA
jgi:hypothetical protein